MVWLRMVWLRSVAMTVTCAAGLVAGGTATAQDMPAEYKTVLSTLGKTGDFKDGVLKVNIPRNDLRVTIRQRSAPTPFGFGGWVALTKGDNGTEVLMGDLVLTEDEVTPVMSQILQNGLDVTALHNHFFWEQPRIFYMHVHGMGSAEDLSRRVKPAIDLIDQAAKRAQASATSAPPAASGTLDSAALAKIIGHQGEQNGPVYKITIGRPDIDLREHGAVINARMGLNTWAAFAGTDADAMVAGDVAMLEQEVTPVLKALRANDLNIVAIHHHMTGVKPVVIFLHYYGTGPAARLARGVRAAVDVLGKGSPQSNGESPAFSAKTGKAPTVLFMCPHGAAKSVLASAYFQRLAKERGLNVRVESAGTEPDAEVAPAVAAHLTTNGYAVPIAKPRQATAQDFDTADVIISIGCNLKGLPQPRGTLVKWDDVPAPSEDFGRADDTIRKRVMELVEELVRKQNGPPWYPLPLLWPPVDLSCSLRCHRRTEGVRVTLDEEISMAKSKRAPTLTPAGGLDWTGVRTQRVEYEPPARIFAQGDPATSVMYVEKGAVRLSVLSHAGKEAVIAVLEGDHFFGEGCLAGQSRRMATATAMAPCAILTVEKQEMVRQLHAQPRFADRFLTHMLTRNIRIEEDLIDQLFNSSEKRLARTLLLLARYGEPEASHRALPRVSQELLAEMVGTTRSRVNFFMNKFRKLGFIDYNGGLKIHNSLLTVVLRD